LEKKGDNEGKRWAGKEVGATPRKYRFKKIVRKVNYRGRGNWGQEEGHVIERG